MRHPHQTDPIYPAWSQGVSKEPPTQLYFRTASLSLEITTGRKKKPNHSKNKNVNDMSQIFKWQNLCWSKDIF